MFISGHICTKPFGIVHTFACVSLGTKGQCQLEEQRLINEESDSSESDSSDSYMTSFEDEELQDQCCSKRDIQKEFEEDFAAGQSSK